MGVHCEINLQKPADEAFVPGSSVSGVIKYAVDEETTFDKIIVSLKGKGDLTITDKQKRRQKSVASSIYRNSEDYVDIDNVIQDDEKGVSLPIGAYETPFTFRLPLNIPSTFQYFEHKHRYIVRCDIKYYIRIKFDRPGVFKFAKHFKKDITVVSGITPTLPTEPTIYGEQKSLTQWFSSRKSIVNIKATIDNSVIKPGDKINVKYEVKNDTNLTINGVETKLVEKYTFTPSAHRDVKFYDDIKDTDSKTGSVKIGDTQEMAVEFSVPSDKMSLQNSKIVSRDYAVIITAILPWYHRNAVLEIPVQVGDTVPEGDITYDEPPPSYWEVMCEGDKDSGDEKEKS